MGLRIGEELEYMRDTVHPSSYLAYRFEGVELAPDLDMDRRRGLVNMFVEIYNLLYRTGWYDHTGDWDFHVGVYLTDGRENDHIGDGAVVSFGTNQLDDGGMRMPDNYSGSDTTSVFHVEGPDVWDEPGDGVDPLIEYRVSTDEARGDVVWEFPIELIGSLRFGYCT